MFKTDKRIFQLLVAEYSLGVGVDVDIRVSRGVHWPHVQVLIPRSLLCPVLSPLPQARIPWSLSLAIQCHLQTRARVSSRCDLAYTSGDPSLIRVKIMMIVLAQSG